VAHLAAIQFIATITMEGSATNGGPIMYLEFRNKKGHHLSM
jgi:hypothetical protein